MSAQSPVGVLQILSFLCDSRRIVNVHFIYLFFVNARNDGIKHEAKICIKIYFAENTLLRQMKHQLDATLCRFYFCRVTLHVRAQAPIIRSI